MVNGENSKSKGFGDFFLAIPWPWYLVLSVAAYLVLRLLAGREIQLPGDSPEEVALYTHRVVWRLAAAFFQYAIPAAFALLAIFSARRALTKRRQGPEER